MSSAIEILGVAFAIVVIGAIIGYYARVRNASLEQWAIGGRSVGTLLIWFLMAGEIYTAFTFLGVPGFAYAYGSPAYYALSYGVLAYLFSYILLPKIWRASKKNGIITQPDFFRERYGSKALSTLVAIVGVIFMVPYLELQVSAIALILGVMGNNLILPAFVMIITFGVVAGYVVMNGLRSATFTSFFKDGLALVVIIVAIIAVPILKFGSLSNMMHQMVLAHENYLYLPGNSPLGISWFFSVVLMSSLGFFVWPHAFQAFLSAKNDGVLRKNAILLPVYNVLLLVTVFMGFAALLVYPGLTNSNSAFLVLVKGTFPSWWTGVVTGAILLGSMVPASVLLIASSTIISKNIYKDLIKKDASDKSVTTVARIFVIIITAVALFFAIVLPALFVNLLLVGYSGITLFLPGVALGVFWRKATKVGVFSGIVMGLATNVIFFLVIKQFSAIVYPGLLGLLVDAVVTVLVSLVTKPPSEEVIKGFLEA